LSDNNETLELKISMLLEDQKDGIAFQGNPDILKQQARIKELTEANKTLELKVSMLLGDQQGRAMPPRNPTTMQDQYKAIWNTTTSRQQSNVGNTQRVPSMPISIASKMESKYDKLWSSFAKPVKAPVSLKGENLAMKKEIDLLCQTLEKPTMPSPVQKRPQVAARYEPITPNFWDQWEKEVYGKNTQPEGTKQR
jgi:hypothetical protein